LVYFLFASFHNASQIFLVLNLLLIGLVDNVFLLHRLIQKFSIHEVESFEIFDVETVVDMHGVDLRILFSLLAPFVFAQRHVFADLLVNFGAEVYSLFEFALTLQKRFFLLDFDQLVV